VSLEVSPALAHDTEGTAALARSLHRDLNLPNLMVKIPATLEGLPAIQQIISEGRNINVTVSAHCTANTKKKKKNCHCHCHCDGDGDCGCDWH